MPVIRIPNTSLNEADDSSIGNRKIAKKMDLLDKKMDGLYRDIYVSRPDNRKNLDNVLDKIDTTIDNLQTNEISVSNMSELLRRIQSRNGGQSSNTKKLMTSVGELFSDQNVIDSLFMNETIHKYIASQNYQYDMICRYLPKVLDALEIKRDTVLCSDNFSKDFISANIGKSNKEDLEKFSTNSANLEKNYEIQDFFDKTYMNTSKYGEDFIYIVPYTAAFKKMLGRSNQRKNNARLGQFSFYESSVSDTIVKEGYVGTDDFKSYSNIVKDMIPVDEYVKPDLDFKGFSVNLHFNDSNIITSTLNEHLVLESIEEVQKFIALASVYEQAFDESTEVSDSLSYQMNELMNKNDKISSASSNDGLIIPGNLDTNPDKIAKDMLGAVVERLPRENVVPVYIGKKCVGYYYLEFAEDKGACGFCGSHHMTPGISNSQNYQYEMSEDQQELAIRYIASKMSANIDTHFINANKDLKEEIYAVLRYNEKFDISRSNDIGVTFIPAEDIVHCYFEMNEDTHRGISDLEKSIVPAMLYILLYLTDIIGKITRSTDKRIYYVKQNVETNVARTMMNVVAQIKKSNMGMRQIESMNNILNIVGKYNDYIIPMGQSGDAPIQFEVMQGQDIQTPTEIMEKMEEAAVNGTGVPFEMLNSIYQQDFATRFQMSNAKFLKSVYTRQRKTQNFFTKIYTKIYNYEYGENNNEIKVILPPPIYLSASNNQQLIDNISQQADKIIEFELAEEEDEVKTEWKKLYMRNQLASYIDFAEVTKFLDSAKVNIESRKVPETIGSSDDGSDMMDDEY